MVLNHRVYDDNYSSSPSIHLDTLISSIFTQHQSGTSLVPSPLLAASCPPVRWKQTGWGRAYSGTHLTPYAYSYRFPIFRLPRPLSLLTPPPKASSPIIHLISLFKLLPCRVSIDYLTVE
jgi:hypothetical protein